MTPARRLAALSLLVGLAQPLLGAPELTALFPAGGQRGQTVEITATGTFPAWPAQLASTNPGVKVSPAAGTGKFRVTIAPDAAPGPCWLRPHDSTGAGAPRPFLVGTLPEVSEVEPNDAPRTAQKLPTAAVVNGKFQKGRDVDCFAVAVKKGETLVAALEANHTLRSPMDAVLQIVSADGFVLEQNNDHHGSDPLAWFTAPSDGTYIVRAFAFPSQPDSTINFAGGDAYIYRLTVTTGPWADHVLPLALPAAKPGSVSLQGWNLPPSLRTLDLPASPADVDGSVAFDARAVNPFRVRREPHPCIDASRAAPAGALVPPFSLTGVLRAEGDVGAVHVQAKAGQRLQAQVVARALGFALEPTLRVLDAEGKQLARAEPPALYKDSELSFTPPRDGTYRFEVRDQYAGGGDRYAYLLRVTPPEPDFTLSVALDRFVVVPGTPLEIPVTLTRRNGHTAEVALSVEGLPDGIRATVPGPDAKAKGLLVRLTADKPGPAGQFRIVGRTRTGPARVLAATAALAAFDTTTSDLWVTSSTTPAPPPPARKTRKK